MRTLGVDLAAEPANTAACLIDWCSGNIEVAPSQVTDDQIVDLARSATVTGVDVPLGWPDGFVRAVSGHHRRDAWSVLGAGTVVGRKSLRYRTTDLRLREVGHSPLSVSTELIGVVALRAALLQQLFVTAGLDVDRSGVTGHMVEAYPAAALRSWGLPSRGYKGVKNQQPRSILVGKILEEAGPIRDAASSALAGVSDHVLDAFVCAIIAAAACVGRTALPDPVDRIAAGSEGWIHVPTAPIADIIKLARRTE